MSIESARDFMEKYKKDAEMSAKMVGAKNPAEKMAIAKTAGFDFSFEELTRVNEELSEAELDTVVGGEWNPGCNNDGHCGFTCENDDSCYDNPAR